MQETKNYQVQLKHRKLVINEDPDYLQQAKEGKIKTAKRSIEELIKPRKIHNDLDNRNDKKKGKTGKIEGNGSKGKKRKVNRLTQEYA